ncbi:MAG: cyclase, partial [Dehalococcoidia bacterium]|nr:cyclase [Dehalococcoidia bacterium]
MSTPLPRYRIVDLTHPISGSMPMYPSDPQPEVRQWTRTHTHGYKSEVLHLGTHTGTHMDAPSHFLPSWPSIDALPLNGCMLPGMLLDVQSLGPFGRIDRAVLLTAEAAAGSKLARGEAALLWTGWSER